MLTAASGQPHRQAARNTLRSWPTGAKNPSTRLLQLPRRQPLRASRRAHSNAAATCCSPSTTASRAGRSRRSRTCSTAHPRPSAATCTTPPARRPRAARPLRRHLRALRRADLRRRRQGPRRAPLPALQAAIAAALDARDRPRRPPLLARTLRLYGFLGRLVGHARPPPRRRRARALPLRPLALAIGHPPALRHPRRGARRRLPRQRTPLSTRLAPPLTSRPDAAPTTSRALRPQSEPREARYWPTTSADRWSRSSPRSASCSSAESPACSPPARCSRSPAASCASGPAPACRSRSSSSPPYSGSRSPNTDARTPSETEPPRGNTPNGVLRPRRTLRQPADASPSGERALAESCSRGRARTHRTAPTAREPAGGGRP